MHQKSTQLLPFLRIQILCAGEPPWEYVCQLLSVQIIQHKEQ
jgi:hypothetical protein